MIIGEMECLPILIVAVILSYITIQVTGQDYEDWFKVIEDIEFIEEFVPVQMEECPSEYNICKEDEFCHSVKIDNDCEYTDTSCNSKRKAVCNNFLLPENHEVIVDRGDTVQWQTINDDADSYIAPENLLNSTPAPTLLMSIPYDNSIDLNRFKRNVTNCEYFAIKDTYKCQDWGSPTLNRDIIQARKISRRKAKRKYHLRLYNDPITPIMKTTIEENYNITSDFSVAKTEWVTRYIYIPCLNHMIQRYIRWSKTSNRIKSRRIHNDIKIMNLAVFMKKKCSMPFTQLRKNIIRSLLMKYIEKAQQTSTKRFLTTMADRITLISTINGAKENSFFQKSLRNLYKLIIKKDVYSEEIIKELVEETNTIPEVKDELVQKRLKKVMSHLDNNTTTAKVLEEIFQTLRKSDVR